MIYLIEKLALWLFLAAAFAALAGWAWAAQRARSAQQAQARERERLLRDLARTTLGDGESDLGAERESESVRRLLEIRDGRIVELEHLLAAARDRADTAVSRAAEIERDEPTRTELERAEEVQVVALPQVEDEAVALNAWRLRYFEQRVRYLEDTSRVARAHEPSEAAPLLEWRARDAEARAAHLESEMRVLRARTPDDGSAFAANADVDALLRWRTLYLERRCAHLQNDAASPPAVQAPSVVEDGERWKWRSRYLEARLRHIEQHRAVPQAIASPQAQPPPAHAAPSASHRSKPPVLSGARNGAPDDFTLIDGVSSLQRTTLYSLGIFHFDQIAAWSAENVAWVDQYLRLGGRIESEEWVEQAANLARDGVSASRRLLADEGV